MLTDAIFHLVWNCWINFIKSSGRKDIIYSDIKDKSIFEVSLNSKMLVNLESFFFNIQVNISYGVQEN